MCESTSHPQGLREQHPDIIHQDSTLLSNRKYNIGMFYVGFHSRQADTN